MKIAEHLTDRAVLQELGRRLAGTRLERNLTQAMLAEEAGVSKRTVERLESGEVAIHLSSFLRLCRTLGLLERFDAILPQAVPGPMAQLRLQGRERRRASGKKAAKPGKWEWGE